MSLSVGAQLGHYTVTTKIGEGGMGEVWQATDTKLNRQVALKILPEAFASNPDRLKRFHREARVLASLNHPGIAAIYGFEESDGVTALVLELVKGPTLADRIRRGPIPIDEALRIARQIAEALEAAHAAGVIHRDLKPANIKVREDGAVKVLDFGLAKALDTSSPDSSELPTRTAVATRSGTVMGTAAYMSPEQATGRPVDERADVWAFGVVLYEALSGRRAFSGEGVSGTLASVLRDEPDWSALPSEVAANTSQALKVCLQKDPKRRVRDVGAVRLAIEGAFETTVSASHSGAPRPPVRERASLLVVGGIVLGTLLTGLVAWSFWPSLPPALATRFVVSASPDPMPIPLSTVTELAISPSGRAVVYRATGDGEVGLFLRHLDRLESELLVSMPNAFNVFFSPDGAWVGFFTGSDSENTLKRISTTGGPVVTISPIAARPRGASWGPDGMIVYSFAGTRVGLFRISAAGGEPEALTSPEASERHFWPEVLPSGNAVVFAVLGPTGDAGQIAVIDLETGEQRVLVQPGTHPRYLSTGHLVYSFGNDLWAVRFDAERLEVLGDPFLVLEGVPTSITGGANVDVSDNGTLVYQLGEPDRSERTLVWVDRNGQEEAIGMAPRAFGSLRLSPDGGRVAVDMLEQSDSDVFLYDLATGVEDQLTFDPARDLFPVWRPDGSQILFSSRRNDGVDNLHVKEADGTGTARPLTRSVVTLVPESFADNETLLLGDGNDVLSLRLGPDAQPQTLLETPETESQFSVSPNGRWLVYRSHSNSAGEPRIYVRSFPDMGSSDPRLVSDGPGTDPLWGPGGRELFYLTRDSAMVVPVETGDVFRRRTPQELFSMAYYHETAGFSWDVSPDGQRFLMIAKDPEPTASHILAVENWGEEVKSLEPDRPTLPY